MFVSALREALLAGEVDHVPLDVPIAQVMVMGGIAVAAVGVLALSPALRRPAGRGPSAGGGTGRWLRGVSVALVAAGVAAWATAYDLTGTAKLTAAGPPKKSYRSPSCTSGPATAGLTQVMVTVNS